MRGKDWPVLHTDIHLRSWAVLGEVAVPGVMRVF